MGFKLLDLLYPENLYCICCEDCIDKKHVHGLCDKCISKINWISDNPYKPSMDSFYFDELFSCCIYGYYPRLAINKLKKGEAYIAKYIGRLLSDRLNEELIDEDGGYQSNKYDALTFVPSTKERIEKRGFNQAKLLAKEVSKNTGIELVEATIKTQNTASLRKASMQDRRTMLAGSFDIAKNCENFIKDKCIVLVDDIVTTGSTVNEVASVLKKYGAKRVDVLCFACGNNLHDEDFKNADFLEVF